MTELQQVVLNFVVNAEQAIVMSGRRPGRITLRTRDEGDRVILEVEDTGPGFRTTTRQSSSSPSSQPSRSVRGPDLASRSATGSSIRWAVTSATAARRRVARSSISIYLPLLSKAVTDRLYYTEPSRRRFDAIVTRVFEHQAGRLPSWIAQRFTHRQVVSRSIPGAWERRRSSRPSMEATRSFTFCRRR